MSTAAKSSSLVQTLLFLTALCIATIAHCRPAAHSQPKDDETEVRSTATKLFEGDILLVDGDKPYGYRKRRSDILISSGQEADIMGGSDTEYTHVWPNRTVYYKFAQTLSENYRRTFQDAMDEWAEHTCITFVLADGDQPDYIIFVQSDGLGCSSYVGRKGGAQLVSMSDYCIGIGHAIHEIGHAIGQWHEHSRPDRDDFIDVLYDNIKESETENFGKIVQEKFELVPDVGYDVESIMHYGPFAFTKDDRGPLRQTIRLREDANLDYKHCTNLLSMGQRDELSFLDKLRANKLYKCYAQIETLVSEGRDCILATTPPTPEPTAPLSTMPEPTPSQPTLPTPTPPQRLKSGSVITMRLDEHGAAFDDLDSMKCTPTCKVTSCLVAFGRSSCNRLDYRFEIVVPEVPDAKKIKSGDKVALRSKSNPSQWLDCSGSDGSCSVTRCASNKADALNTSITTCDNHYFKIIGVGRKQGRLINTNHSIQLRHELNDSFLNCDEGDKCKLEECTDTCLAPSYRFNILL